MKYHYIIHYHLTFFSDHQWSNIWYKMSSQILPQMYLSRRSSEDKTHLDMDQDSVQDGSRSNSPRNVKFYKRHSSEEDKTILHNQGKKSFCIDALLSKQIDPEETNLQERTQQKYFAFLNQQKNFIQRFQEAENYDNQIEKSMINKYDGLPGRSPGSGMMEGRSSSEDRRVEETRASCSPRYLFF